MQIICVDPNRHELSKLQQHVRQLIPDAEIHGSHTPAEGIALAREHGCDVLLTEIGLNNVQVDGFVLAERIAEFNPKVNIIFVSERMDNAMARSALELHACGYIKKPYGPKQLSEEFAHLRYIAV